MTGGPETGRREEGPARVLPEAEQGADEPGRPGDAKAQAGTGSRLEVRDGDVDYRTLVEQGPAITYTQAHGPVSASWQRTTYVSTQVTRILGHAPSEFLADPELWRTLRHPADRARVMAAERTSEVTHQPFRAEYRMLTRDARMLWFRDEAVIVPDHETGGTLWQGVMFDITAEKQAVAQAREAEVRYRSLVETLPAMVFVDQLDEQATNIYTSPQTEAMFGYTPQEWKDIPDLWVRLIHPEDKERVFEAQQRYAEAEDDGVFEQEYRMVARDERVVWVRDVAFVVRDAEGMPLYSQGFMLDITKQKEAELELVESVRREHDQAEELRVVDSLKDTLLRTLSHDLKVPLTAIITAATTLQRQGPAIDREEMQELLTKMATRARRMDRLLTDILDLDRLGRGIVEPKRFPVDVADIVEGVVRDCDALEGREVELHLKHVEVEIDKPKVERVVENLLTNAVRHTPPVARIWVRVTPEDRGVLIAVDDEGGGIPDDLKEAIFEPFRQVVDEHGESHPGGAGIGLSLVARFAELHGGRAWVEDRPGGGSSFRVFLP